MGVTPREVLVILDFILMLPGFHILPVLPSHAQPHTPRTSETIRHHGNGGVPHSVDESQSYSHSHSLTPGSASFAAAERSPGISVGTTVSGRVPYDGEAFKTSDQFRAEPLLTLADLVRAWRVFKTGVKRRALLHSRSPSSQGKGDVVDTRRSNVHLSDKGRISAEAEEQVGRFGQSHGGVVSPDRGESHPHYPSHHFGKSPSSVLRKRHGSGKSVEHVKHDNLHKVHVGSSTIRGAFHKVRPADGNATISPGGNSTSAEDNAVPKDTQTVLPEISNVSNERISADDTGVRRGDSGTKPANPSHKSSRGRQKRSFYLYDVAAVGLRAAHHHTRSFPRLEKLKSLYLGLLRTKNSSHSYVDKRLVESENVDSVSSVPQRRIAGSDRLSSRKPAKVSKLRLREDESAKPSSTLGASQVKHSPFDEEKRLDKLKYGRMRKYLSLLRSVLNSSGSPSSPRGSQQTRKDGVFYNTNVPLSSQTKAAKDMYHYGGNADVGVLVNKVTGDVPLQGKGSPIILQTRSGTWSREELVRRLHQPSQLQSLQSETSLTTARDRQDKQKKERLLQDLLHDATPLEQQEITDTAVCATDDASAQEMRCPSDASICLLDVMFCDGVRDCPQGEDEATSLCILRLWAFRWLNHIQHMLGTYFAYSSRDIPQRSHGHKRSYDRNGDS